MKKPYSTYKKTYYVQKLIVGEKPYSTYKNIYYIQNL